MHANFYTGNPLDRLALRRDDEAFMLELLHDPASRFLPVWRDRHLIAQGETQELRVGMPTRQALGHPVEALAALPWVLLGLQAGDRAVFAVDLGALEEPAALVPPEFGRFEPLRPLAPSLPADEAAILAQARGLLHWRRNHLFCGHCGQATVPQQGGTRLGCPECGLQHFPRTDPVVIMLVHHEGRALLARGTRFPGRRLFSALAGFIEPGESAEEAVAREVFEETGIRLRRIAYHSSQPWPYPNSLMLGFLAEAEGRALTLDDNEIVEAHWLTPDEVRHPERLDIELPGATAIAHSLISAWLG
ncbi:NAD(+) diphosphatase [Lichenicoccus sp.]|uniref:NAD(+) diphosphatase n=1 Tax=Lichenicoccus sp. TaxID=2781899 RepID=UPI003D0B60AB